MFVFWLPIYSWAWGLPWRMVDFLSETLLEQTNFISASGCRELLRQDENVCPLVSALGSHLMQTWAGPVRDATAPDSNATLRFHRRKWKWHKTGREQLRKRGKRSRVACWVSHAFLAGPAFILECKNHSGCSSPGFLSNGHLATGEQEGGRGELPEHFIAFISHPNI